MRIMVAAWPSTTHVYPVVPLVWALQSAGHEVRVATYPSMADAITKAGLNAVVLGECEELPTKPIIDEQHLAGVTEALKLSPHESVLWAFFRHRVLPVLSKFHADRPAAAGHRPMADDLIDFARTWRPDLILWDASFFAAPLAARACGAAHARLMIGVDYWAWSREIFRERLGDRHPQWGSDPLADLLQPLFERYGVESDDEMFIGQWTVDPTPPRMQLPLDVRYVPVRAVPYNGAVAVPPWVHEPPTRPRVCLTAGLSGRERMVASGVSLPELIRSLAELDIELVATLNKDQLDDDLPLPDNVRLVDYMPLDLLLPSCAAVLHHGGPGTFAAAIAARVPQLITGVLSSWDNGASAPAAQYVVERQAGLAVDQESFSADVLKSGVSRLLEDVSFREGTMALYEDLLAAPSPAAIVPALERLTALHHG